MSANLACKNMDSLSRYIRDGIKAAKRQTPEFLHFVVFFVARNSGVHEVSTDQCLDLHMAALVMQLDGQCLSHDIPKFLKDLKIIPFTYQYGCASEYVWTPDESDDVPLIIGTDERQKNNRTSHFQAKTFIRYLIIIILSTALIAAIFYFVYNDPNCDSSKAISAEQKDDEIGNSCGPIFTCDYYLNTPCKSSCWHNTPDVRDRECKNMGSFNCRWSFEAPMALIQGTCYCCDLKCDTL
ncbi:hypothetical protein HA402_002906 [Bradysia odoriphaga]|nr:hypothetical protein HA402_002906 [Bradysia odoriphaga]